MTRRMLLSTAPLPNGSPSKPGAYAGAYAGAIKPGAYAGAIHLNKAAIDRKILFLNTSPTIGTELYDEFRNKKSPFPDASDQNQTTKLPLSISFNQTTVAEMQLAEDLRHAGRGEPPVLKPLCPRRIAS